VVGENSPTSPGQQPDDPRGWLTYGPLKLYIDDQVVAEQEIRKVVYDVADDAYIDVERHLAAAIARD
jgi:hypothetical protein